MTDTLTALIGETVHVYKNLRRGDWSVRLRGKVVAHVPEIVLSGVTFDVRESRRQAVIAKHCREVHAWAVGTVASFAPVRWNAALPQTPITYSPYRAGTFTRRSDGSPVTAARYVHFTQADGAVAVGAIDG